jgi:hypothetical protein
VVAQQRNFCSCTGTAHFHLRQTRRVLSFAHRGWGTFINNQFSNPEAAVRKCLRLFQWRLRQKKRHLCAAPPLLRRSGRDLRLSKERHDPARGVAGFNFHDRMDKPRDERPFYGQRCLLAAMRQRLATFGLVVSNDCMLYQVAALKTVPRQRGEQEIVATILWTKHRYLGPAHRRTASGLF